MSRGPRGKWGKVNAAKRKKKAAQNQLDEVLREQLGEEAFAVAIERRGNYDSKAERKRASVLQRRLEAGALISWKHDSVRLRLGKGSFYSPDFYVVESDRTITHEEVKGRAGYKLDDEGRTKIKLAAERYPEVRFRGAVLTRSGWREEEVLPHCEFPPGDTT